MFTQPEEYILQIEERINSLTKEVEQLQKVKEALLQVVHSSSNSSIQIIKIKNPILTDEHKKRIREAMIATNQKKRAELQEKLKKAITSGIGYTVDELVQKLKKPKNTILRVLNEDPYFVKKNDHWYSIL